MEEGKYPLSYEQLPSLMLKFGKAKWAVQTKSFMLTPPLPGSTPPPREGAINADYTPSYAAAIGASKGERLVVLGDTKPDGYPFAPCSLNSDAALLCAEWVLHTNDRIAPPPAPTTASPSPFYISRCEWIPRAGHGARFASHEARQRLRASFRSASSRWTRPHRHQCFRVRAAPMHR